MFKTITYDLKEKLRMSRKRKKIKINNRFDYYKVTSNSNDQQTKIVYPELPEYPKDIEKEYLKEK